MYSKFISVAFVLAATLAPTSAVALPRGNNIDARDDPKIATATPIITATPTIATPTPTLSPSITHSSAVTPSITSTSPTTSPPTTTHTTPSSSIITPPANVTPIPKPSETARRDGQPGTGPASTSSCNNVQPWQVNLAYSAGAQVIFKNQLWTASQWNYNNSPDSAAGAWTLNGPCNPPINNKVDCTGVSAWNQATAYPGGSKVTLNGHLWTSTQWTQSNTPGDTSGTWKDSGACM